VGKREDDVRSGYDAAAAALGQASEDVAAASERVEAGIAPFEALVRRGSDPASERLLMPAIQRGLRAGMGLSESSKLTPRERAEALVKALPATVRIGPHDYAIRTWDPLQAESHKRFAEIDHLCLVISLSELHASPTQFLDSLLHEMLHGVWRHGDLDKESPEERAVGVLSTGLVGLFRDNPWLTGWIASAVKGV